MRWYVPAVLILGLAACTADTSTCPPVVNYTADEKRAAGAELERMVVDGSYPNIVRFMGDYKAERAELRACFN